MSEAAQQQGQKSGTKSKHQHVRKLPNSKRCLAHIWIGLAILAVADVRIPWRIANSPPKIVITEFGRWLVEWTDPASLCPLWIIGCGTCLRYRAAVRTGPPLPLFGLGEIPSPWPADKAFAHNVEKVHEILANILVVLAVFHMTAALAHHIVFRDNTLRRMLPHLRK